LQHVVKHMWQYLPREQLARMARPPRQPATQAKGARGV